MGKYHVVVDQAANVLATVQKDSMAARGAKPWTEEEEAAFKVSDEL